MALFALVLLAATPTIAAADQPRPTPAHVEAAAPPAAVDEQTARDTRERLRQILEQYPPSVAQVLRLDPSLLTKADYLAPYPTLAAYLAQHPEVAHNPVFFIGSGSSGGPQYSDNRSQAIRATESIFTEVFVLLGFVAAFCTLGWITRSMIEHRRWKHATKLQTDAHTKIIDRLASNEDLLAYIQSPNGQRYLTASLGPATFEAMLQPIGAPLGRILWSVQAGIVLAAAGLGLWFAKNSVIEEAAQALQVVAILSIALGIGFVLSALVSYMLSRELGLVHTSTTPHA